MKIIEPIDIILVTYQRLHFLKRTLEAINDRTFYPYRLIVVDNNSTDGTQKYLKRQNKIGRVQECIFLSENLGLPEALNKGFELVRSDLFITTQDDLIPPDLRPCWLERLVHLFNKYYPDYGSICMRIQRTRRLEWNEEDDIIENKKSMPAVFRIQKKSDLEKLGNRPFGKLRHWESHTFARTMRQLKKKFGMATHLYANHLGFMSENKGYPKGFTDYFTYSKERVKQGEDKPYPDIDPKTNIPIKINHPVDREEQRKREQYLKDAGAPWKRNLLRKQSQRDLLSKYCKGKGIDVGCNRRKIHPDAIGIDLYPWEGVDIVGDGTDLWMFADEDLDYIVSCHFLEHCVDTKKVLKEWDRVLKKG